MYVIIIIRQPLCPVVGRRPQHVVSKLPCLVLFSAISCPSSICPGRLSTAWLVSLVRGRPWRYSVIPSTPDFPTEYQIRRHSNPAGLPTFAAIWGPDFRASIIRLTCPHVFKQIKIYNYFDDDVQSQSSPTKLRRPTVGGLISMQRRGTRATVTGDCWLCILRVASCLVLCALKVRLPPSKVDNCNKGGSQLPHRAHISRASCLKKPAEPNDILVFSARCSKCVGM